ncbi:hypothetical protein GJ744_007937 [Endocarpon pusillum]|uniref:Hydrophobin n=1 Tax=Endocarpon pusillum TaxID=364733 RepID=A0A8H7AKB0_9EURO|nr:hypothetical protein GJ744_007937 [Endocarpon pusillum]
MQTKIISLFALITLAAARPQGGNSSNRCPSNQREACCNSLLNVLTCVPILSGGTCSGGVTACCTTDDNTQTGLINVGSVCVPVSVL